MLGYLARKAQICGTMFYKSVPFLMPCSMTTGSCSQHIEVHVSYKCLIIKIDLLYNILYNFI